MNFRVSFVLGMGSLLLLSGFDEVDVQQEQVRQREDIRQLQEKINQFQNDVQAMQLENESLKAALARLKADLASSQETREKDRKETERLDLSVQKLEANRQQDRKIIVGEVSRELDRFRKGAESASAKPKDPKPSKPVEEGYEHIVVKGQSLYAIAEAYGVTVQSVKEANKLKSNELRAGQKLFIPKK